MNIPIFLASDENYAKYMAVTMTSIFTNTEEFIEFYILDGGIKEESKKKIEDLKNIKSNFSIEFITVDMSLFEKFPTVAHFTSSMYSRYLIPELKPTINKAIYMDVDVIVNGDIKELYTVELENFPIAATPYLSEFENSEDPWCNLIKKRLGINKNSKYFNSGLLLINCDYLRAHNLQKILFEKTAEMVDILWCPDQDVMNVAYENNYKILDYKFNVVIDITQKKFLDNILKEFCILHYTGGKGYRPWLNSECPCGDEFWKYAKLTPFYDELINDLNHYDIAKNRKNKVLKFKYKLYKVLDILTMKKITFFNDKFKQVKKVIKGC